MPYLMISFVTFGEKFDVAESIRRLVESLLFHPLSAPLNLCALELSASLSLFAESHRRHVEWFPHRLLAAILELIPSASSTSSLFETKRGRYLARRNKTAEKMKKRKHEDRLMHLASRRMALTSPKVPVC
ncbi:hypothetical protein H5410_028108 [Solanum commersonii]|uniref:Uncharacterized protein n=1 Tax=Solanum commersonii TaxID=4109 RepID=A0A9J5Z3V7_SOLCO|nr:hypothetical protein H5410_028108 [Solanum commersonii]